MGLALSAFRGKKLTQQQRKAGLAELPRVPGSSDRGTQAEPELEV